MFTDRREPAPRQALFDAISGIRDTQINDTLQAIQKADPNILDAKQPAFLLAGTCDLLVHLVGNNLRAKSFIRSVGKAATSSEVCHGYYSPTEKGHTVLLFEDNQEKFWAYDVSPEQTLRVTQSQTDVVGWGPFGSVADTIAMLNDEYRTQQGEKSQWNYSNLSTNSEHYDPDNLYATIMYNAMHYPENPQTSSTHHT